ncbi:MAG TPA: helix-turn-helix transcriptional regulator [Actinomycetota bacterium]|nr:helix-turn-helix transcriptional regulator [Actinomycetota bacterium]
MPRLTVQEIRTLELVAMGLSTTQIAGRLFVSPQTVAYHVGNLLRKLEAQNRAGLVGRAYFEKVLDADKWPPTADASQSRSGSRLASPTMGDRGGFARRVQANRTLKVRD